LVERVESSSKLRDEVRHYCSKKARLKTPNHFEACFDTHAREATLGSNLLIKDLQAIVHDNAGAFWAGE